MTVSRVKIRDRGALGEDRIRFTSAILPPWARRTRNLDALLPTLYLRGVSTGDFQEALTALPGKEAPALSPSVISRLTAQWSDEYEQWRKRDLSARRYVPALRVCLGRRCLSPGPNGGERRMHAGAFTDTHLEAHQFLAALRRGADQHQHAFGALFH